MAKKDCNRRFQWLVFAATLAIILVSAAVAMGEDAMSLVITLDRSAVDAGSGEAIVATWAASGGNPYVFDDGPRYAYKARWVIYEGTVGYTIREEAACANWLKNDLLVPLFGQRGELLVTAFDDAGNSVTETASFNITGSIQALPLESKLSLNKQSVRSGETLTATWKTAGGSGIYHSTLRWIISETDPITKQKTSSTVRTITTSALNEDSLMVVAGETCYATVVIRDNQGRETSASSTPAIIGQSVQEYSPLNVELTHALPCPAGKKIPDFATVYSIAKATGGKEPYQYVFDWYRSFPFGNAAPELFAHHEGTEATDEVQTKSTYGYVTVTVTDALGITKSETSDYSHDTYGYRHIPGDANGDLKVDILDLVSIIDYIVKDTPVKALVNADFNWNQKIDIIDLVAIIDVIVSR